MVQLLHLSNLIVEWTPSLASIQSSSSAYSVQASSTDHLKENCYNKLPSPKHFIDSVYD